MDKFVNKKYDKIKRQRIKENSEFLDDCLEYGFTDVEAIEKFLKKKF